MRLETTYFEEAGIACTDETVRLAVNRAKELGLDRMVVACTRGHTVRAALPMVKGTAIKMLIVGEDRPDFPSDLIGELEAAGHKVVFGSEISYTYPEVVANAYRKLGEGVKVAVECSAIACDVGFVEARTEVVSVAGTGPWGYEDKGGGADTALVVEAHPSAEHGEDFAPPEKAKRRRIKELLAKPR